jgi:indolepyruvate ferredoxin oxidoreductase
MAIAVPPRGGGLERVTLEDRWREQARAAPLSGIQAIVRALLDERREDARLGVRSAGFASGYPGSPLGGLDKELMRQHASLQAAGVVFQPGVNEELAATAVWGSQLAHTLPNATVDGVLGLWFGKSPGLDRAADAIRHASLSGVGPASGALAVVGDDPGCKSSTLPSSSERTLAGLLVPVLAPSSPQDVLDLGRHGLRLSRAAGLWCALKVVADVADATETVSFGGPRGAVGRLVEHAPNARLLAATSLNAERSLDEVRLPAALAYAHEHGLNRVVAAATRDELGVIAGGSAYAELARALDDLGLHESELAALGVRVLKVGMLWPLARDAVRGFAAGLRSVLVIEDKLPFLEDEVKSALYGLPHAPQVLGKLDADGQPLLPSHGALSADQIARTLGRLLADRLSPDSTAVQRLARLERGARAKLDPLPLARTPFFCSGCPHSTSTHAEPGTLVGAGIGCHTMIVQDELAGTGRVGEVVSLTQMGGEGAQWIGMAPFAGTDHFTQNIGDGTFHHSGSLALRAAVAAKANITYKLLYNDVVAMTGAQDVQGGMSVAELTRMLTAEGIARIAITTDEPARYRRLSRMASGLRSGRAGLRAARLAHGVKVYDRAHLPEVERELAATAGVTVLIHDQMCAAERRRLRRRGRLPEPAEHAFINERVCEGCGDCGEKSGCLSVEPVQTELGRRTRIHQESCNRDVSCLRGDCPSFLTVRPGKRSHERRLAPTDLPGPPLHTPLRPVEGAPPANSTVRMVGIGGTGVVTVAQVLAMAAHLEDRAACVLDQTGLSQKGGPVVSDVRIGQERADGAAPRAVSASIDLLLGFDLLGAADPRYLAAADPERTIAVLNDAEKPTGAIVLRPSIPYPPHEELLGRVRARVADVPVLADAQRIAERAFGEDLQSNMVLLGAAWQLGVLPVGWEALSRAIELNGTAVQDNLAALSWGRAIVAAPDAVRALVGSPRAASQLPLPDDVVARVVATPEIPERLRELVGRRAADLRQWGGARPRDEYLAAVAHVARLEQERAPGHGEITESVARHLHHLTAYKDEYEVARLHLLPAERERREREFGPGARWWVHLHPPLLRALGLSHKVRLGRYSLPLLYVLRAGRRLRGTPLDLFGYASMRKLERALPGEYLELVQQGLARLTPRNHGYVLALSEQADAIRGYEDVKLRGVATWREASAQLLGQVQAQG